MPNNYDLNNSNYSEDFFISVCKKYMEITGAEDNTIHPVSRLRDRIESVCNDKKAVLINSNNSENTEDTVALLINSNNSENTEDTVALRTEFASYKMAEFLSQQPKRKYSYINDTLTFEEGLFNLINLGYRGIYCRWISRGGHKMVPVYDENNEDRFFAKFTSIFDEVAALGSEELLTQYQSLPPQFQNRQLLPNPPIVDADSNSVEIATIFTKFFSVPTEATLNNHVTVIEGDTPPTSTTTVIASPIHLTVTTTSR